LAQTPPILIVEDDPDWRELMRLVLMLAGYDVETAADGQDALEALAKGIVPRLMIVDLMMPRVSGDQFLQWSRKNPAVRQVPTIIVTATPRYQVTTAADAVLSKPCDPARLVSTVKHLLHAH
jgi:CheY-like chemotaxis protein